jgi:hypothetical protein
LRSRINASHGKLFGFFISTIKNTLLIFTKHMSNQEWMHLMKPMIFWWTEDDEDKNETNEDTMKSGSINGITNGVLPVI